MTKIHITLKYPETHRSWMAMKRRCYNPNCDAYRWYGAKGIKVCNDWQQFANFLRDMGPRPKGTTIDRLNAKLNYEPSNCRWATSKEQHGNMRVTTFTHKGRTLPVRTWAKKFGISNKNLYTRLRRGWPFEVAVSKTMSPGKRPF